MIIAHRGASGEFPENSLLAFEQAINQNADGIELDIQFHQASGEFIILHDRYLDKTTNGVGHYTEQSIEYLRELQLGQGQKLITLKEALSLIRGRTLVNVELKTSESCQIALSHQLVVLTKVINHAIKYDNFSAQQFIFSSFNHIALYQCMQQLPNFSRAALISHCPLNVKAVTNDCNASFINPDINCLNQAMVNDAHKLGLKVLVYTVDRKQDIQRCLEYGVDGIFTNFVQKSRQRLNNCKVK